MKNFASAFLSFFETKKAELNKKLNIHKNGVDNNYPEIVESLISNSVTASQCANIMASYISGKGFAENNKTLVNERKQTTLLQFTQEIAESFSYHKGVFIQVNYNLNYEITDMDVLPYTDCRVGKKDSNDYSGKILVHPNWSEAKKDDIRVVDVFNPKESVIQSQIEKAEGIEKYNGQILFFKFGKYTYPLSPIHPCLEDADSEKRAATYKNISLKKGWFGKELVITKPLVDNNLRESDTKEYQAQVSERDNFRETLKDFVGAENAGGILHLEMEFTSDKIEEEILFKQIESNIDDKLFAFTEQSVSDNIRMCFNNVPAALIRSNDGALFSQSGEAIKAMKEFYQDQTNDERMMVEEIVGKLMKRYKNKQENLTITPLIEAQVIAEAKEVKDPDEAKKQAQAVLKGSVGGVTALLEIQQSVAAGTTQRESALTIIKEIFGIPKDLASEMLGTPKEDLTPLINIKNNGNSKQRNEGQDSLRTDTI